MTMEVEDASSGCIANKETVASHKEVTLEAVMEEITSLKLLFIEMMKKQDTLEKGITNEMLGLKASFRSIEVSIETLEVVSKSKGKDSSSNLEKEAFNDPDLLTEQQRFVKELAQIGSKRKSGNEDETFGFEVDRFHEGLVEETSKRQVFNGGSSTVYGDMETMEDHGIDISVSNRNISTMVNTPFMPGHWLKSDTRGNNKKSAKQSLLITRTDYKRHSHFKQTTPSMVTGGINKKLFHTPSPKPTQSRSSKSSSKAHQSGKKVMVKLEEGTQKEARKTVGATPKGKETHFKLPFDTKHVASDEEMALVTRDAHVCSYLFQKSPDAKLMNETLVWTMDLAATRAELQCLLPNVAITELIIALAAARITTKHIDRQSVWCLPPSFVMDMEEGLTLPEIRAKYCKDWMPPFTDLKFIYIPLRGVQGHWYLMLVHVETGFTYHLDTNCPLGCADARHFKIKKMGLLLYHLIADAEYSIVFRNKRIDFQNYIIVEARGIPNVGSSDNSGVWVLDWLNMEHFFNPDTLVGTLNEKAVRMKIAADLLIGDHNSLRFEVLKKTNAYIKTLAKQPINLDDD